MNETGQPRAFPQEEEENFGLTQLFQSYVNKPEITALSPSFLVAGSKNVLVDYAQRVISRNGYQLYRQANTGGGGIKGSCDWETSLGSQFSLRAWDRTLEFDWNGAYNTLLTGLPSAKIEFAKVLDYAEQQDVLLMVLGEQSMRRWSGGVSLVRSSTANTLTKLGVVTALTTIAFVAGDGSIVAPTITDTANNFVNAGFAAGDTINVSGSVNNNGNFTVGSVAAGTLTLIMSNVLVNEAAGSPVTIYNQTGPTWKSSRFFSSISPRAIMYQGVSYAYTGGESTDTLTGLTAFPTVTNGQAVWQTPDTIALPSDITSPFPNFFPDLIGVQLNIVSLASTKSIMTFGSKNTDYTNFALTTPRAPGDPYQEPLTSGPATCITPVDTFSDILNQINTLIYGSGIDAFDQIDFHMSQDNSEELLRIIRYKTAKGRGLISKSAICPIADNTIYISREPALDFLIQPSVSNEQHKPISDPIKNDFDSYNFTDSHVVYFDRSIFIALPAEGLILIYDMMRNLWQPPQTMPISRFSVIDDELYGHSSIVNETYKLFTGTDDNGVFIHQVARFAYNNGGMRYRLKNLTQHWTDGYITASGTLNYNLFFGYGGSLGVRTMAIVGSDSAVVDSEDATPLGDEELGKTPLGGSPFNPIVGLPGAGIPLLRFYQEDTCDPVDYMETFVEYSMTTLGGQFAIVAHGNNQWDAGTVAITHKK